MFVPAKLVSVKTAARTSASQTFSSESRQTYELEWLMINVNNFHVYSSLFFMYYLMYLAKKNMKYLGKIISFLKTFIIFFRIR